MATPQQIHESDMYRQAAARTGPVPGVWFKDVYEALGEALRLIESQDGALDLFLAMQDYTKVQLEESASEKGKSYWQGVKDGLRKCYALFTNNPQWVVITRVSAQERPLTAYERWELEGEGGEP